MVSEVGVTRVYYNHTVDYDLHEKVVRKTADETINNSTTGTNDDDLFFAIAANEVWFAYFIIYGISGATPDFDFYIVAPSGSDGEILSFRNGQVGTAYNLGNAMEVAGAGENQVCAEFLAIIVNGSTAGNVQLQWSQATAEESDTTVLANSCLIATQLV